MLVTARFVCVVVFQRTWEPPVGSDVGIKFVPVIVRVVPALPAAALLGLMLVTVGTGLGTGKTTNATGLESPFVPVPECGWTVCTKSVPGLAIIEAGSVAVTETTLPVSFAGAQVAAAVVVTTHVLRLFWLKVTTVCTTKPLPVNVSVTVGPPAVMLAGETNSKNAPVLD